MGKTINYKTLASIGIWIICLAGYPFDFRYALGYPFMVPIIIGFLLLSVLLIKNGLEHSIRIQRSLMLLYCCLIFFWLFQMAIRCDLSYISNIFQVLCIVIIFLAIKNFVGVYSISQQFIYFMIANCIGGTIIMLLLIVHNFPPLFQFAQHDGRLGSFYYLTFTNTVFDTGAFSIIRYSGLFDEPGNVAYGCMFALIINRLTLKSRKAELLLLILPIFTFSLAHFVTAILYILFFYWKRTKLILSLAILLTCTFIILKSTKDTDYNRIYSLTLERLEQGDDGTIKGNNREDLEQNALLYFKENPILGKGKTAFAGNTGEIGANIFFYGALYGILGYIFIYIILYYLIFFLIIKHNVILEWCDGLKCCLLIIINLFQRPDMTGIFPLFTLTIFALCVFHLYEKNSFQLKYE